MCESKNNIIIEFISKQLDDTNKNKFDYLMKDIENYVEGGTAHNITELKELFELPANHDETIIEIKETKLRQHIMNDRNIISSMDIVHEPL